MTKNEITRKTIEKDKKIIVTMRCIDMASPTVDVDKIKCSECGEMTWLSASSRNIKFDNIICEPCFLKSEMRKDDDCQLCVTEECLNDAIATLENRGIRTTKEEMITRMEESIGKGLNIVKKLKIMKKIKKKK